MRSRWQEWVITLSIVGLAAFGVYALWGEDLLRAFRPDEAPAETPAPPVVSGPAAGPY